jgi:hypothetical protein
MAFFALLMSDTLGSAGKCETLSTATLPSCATPGVWQIVRRQSHLRQRSRTVIELISVVAEQAFHMFQSSLVLMTPLALLSTSQSELDESITISKIISIRRGVG